MNLLTLDSRSMRGQTTVPQQLTIQDDPKTLRDLHSLCGSINWVSPLIGITTEDLAPLFNLLHGNGGMDSPCALMPEARHTITKVQEALSSHQAHRIKPSLPLQFVILDSYPGQISIHVPKHRLFNRYCAFNLMPKLIQSRTPLKALMVFTDGSGASHKSVMTWMDHKTQKWESDVQILEGSPQIAELAAVVRAFEKFKDKPFNPVIDTAYIAGIAMRAEHALLKEVSKFTPN
ncbi:hypothetical protein HGM15179_019704 [Zosterops borbonicus]|uniref:Reverse transcriptase thumb domain-containing protein n=1 Tax=Zosterops borbonicus TaxID=364589 RepID=A0A8K1D9H3_9PASS|nr:hypothetical protein HGM15179_019704 [Zosterops borbonicus]